MTHLHPNTDDYELAAYYFPECLLMFVKTGEQLKSLADEARQMLKTRKGREELARLVDDYPRYQASRRGELEAS